MNEFRRARRRKAVDPIDVQDSMTETPVGRIGNLSETGMLMMATRAMVDDALYQLRFDLTDSHGRRRSLEVGAHQLWSDKPQSEGKSWVVGFRFIDVGPEDGSFLKEWIEEPGGQYV